MDEASLHPGGAAPADAGEAPRRRPWLLALGAAGAAAATTAVLAVNPNASDSWLPGCVFFHFTGLYCPGCGGTRAAHAMLHGEPLDALAMNALAVVGVPLWAWLFVHLAWPLPRALAPPAWLRDARPWAVAVIGFALLRNLPWVPFSWLAPG
jgi:hypothetical protein